MGQYHWAYYEGTLVAVASQPSVTVASEYPHDTLNGTETCSNHSLNSRSEESGCVGCGKFDSIFCLQSSQDYAAHIFIHWCVVLINVFSIMMYLLDMFGQFLLLNLYIYFLRSVAKFQDPGVQHSGEGAREHSSQTWQTAFLQVNQEDRWFFFCLIPRGNSRETCQGSK